MSLVLSDLPEHERPRERLAALGPDALSERELLALVLRNGRRGESAVDLAGTLLLKFGGLSGLSGALPEEIAAISGIGPAKAAAVVAAFRLGALAGRSNGCPPVLAEPADIALVASEHLTGLRRERLLVLVCDGGNRLTKVAPVADGSMDRCLVPVREILNVVLRHDGRAFALAHNHPSGDPEPGRHDRESTVAVASAAKQVGLRFLDHVVVASGGWRSACSTRAMS